jgi:hypothetical protein
MAHFSGCIQTGQKVRQFFFLFIFYNYYTIDILGLNLSRNKFDNMYTTNTVASSSNFFCHDSTTVPSICTVALHMNFYFNNAINNETFAMEA